MGVGHGACGEGKGDELGEEGAGSVGAYSYEVGVGLLEWLEPWARPEEGGVGRGVGAGQAVGLKVLFGFHQNQPSMDAVREIWRES